MKNESKLQKNNRGPRPVSYGMGPKKQFGQNFLTQPKIAQDIVDAGRLSKKDSVLEIGPGKGMLTEKILATGAKVVAVEKDRDLIGFLENKFEKEIKKSQLKIINEDILSFDVLKNFNGNYKLIANIPYYITGIILRKFLELKNQPKMMVLMIQYEVAKRIVSKDMKESILSISIKAYGTPKIIRRVSAGSFFPKPNVDSAILSIENISKDLFIKNKISEKKFFEIIKKGFSSKRKKLSSNLGFKKELWEKSGLPENIRAEELSLEGWVELTKILLK